MTATNQCDSRFCPCVVPYILMGICFAIVGYHVGWFVGASRTPAVQALIPLVIALLCGLSYGMLDKKALVEGLIGERKADDAAPAAAGSAASPQARTNNWPAVGWATLVAIFSWQAVSGALKGYDFRVAVPAYTKVDDALNGKPISPMGRLYVAEIMLRLHAAGFPPDNVKDFVQSTVLPILEKKPAAGLAADKALLDLEEDILKVRDEVMEIPPLSSSSGGRGLGPQ